MADTEESSTSQDSDGSSSSSSSEGLQKACSEKAGPGNKDPEPSASSLQPASRRKGGTWNSARLVARPAQPSGAGARGGPSAQSSAKPGGQTKLPKPKLDLKALFDYHSRMRQLRIRKRNSRSHKSPQTEVATKHKSPEPRVKRPRLVASKRERKKRFQGRGWCLQFPFMQKVYGRKHVPLRMECLFEHEAVDGFFKYIEKLKFEHHLKKSLAELDATEDLEKESLETRRHKYLDDDGPLSPIEEASGEDMNEDCDTEDIGARIVENSRFILSSQIPEKKKKKPKSKTKEKQDKIKYEQENWNMMVTLHKFLMLPSSLGQLNKLEYSFKDTKKREPPTRVLFTRFQELKKQKGIESGCDCIPFGRRSSDLFLGRGVPGEVISMHYNNPWKQEMKESRLCVCLLNWKDVWLRWDANEARMNNRAGNVPENPDCVAEN